MTLVSAERIYTGKILNLDLDTVRFPNNSLGKLEMIRHPGASAVLPFLDDPRTDNPRLVLIRQFRHAANEFIWEIPAGRLDPGENAEQCAGRELLEETGYAARELRHLTTIYTTPGFTDERIYLFQATGLTAGKHHREADEFLEIHEVRWNDVLTWMEDGRIVDGKTFATLSFVQCFVRKV
jgi:ADP-ribose pyrophosphatase